MKFVCKRATPISQGRLGALGRQVVVVRVLLLFFSLKKSLSLLMSLLSLLSVLLELLLPVVMLLLEVLMVMPMLVVMVVFLLVLLLSWGPDTGRRRGHEGMRGQWGRGQRRRCRGLGAGSSRGSHRGRVIAGLKGEGNLVHRIDHGRPEECVYVRICVLSSIGSDTG